MQILNISAQTVRAYAYCVYMGVHMYVVCVDAHICRSPVDFKMAVAIVALSEGGATWAQSDPTV